MDQETDAGNDQKKNTGKLVDLECKRNMKAADRNKIKIICDIGVSILHLQKNPNAQCK